MAHTDISPLPRRGFLARISTAGAGIAAALASRPALAALPTSSPVLVPESDPDAWIGRLTGKDRLILHAHQQLMPAVYGARNILANAREAWGLAERENSVAIGAHGPAIAGLFGDATWQRFRFGERYKITDPKTGGPAATNPFLAPQDGSPPDAVVPELMNRGVMFVVCNVAVRNLSRRIESDAQAADALHKELLAGLLPGIVVVPDLFVAMSHAQRRGVSYIFTG